MSDNEGEDNWSYSNRVDAERAKHDAEAWASWTAGAGYVEEQEKAYQREREADRQWNLTNERLFGGAQTAGHAQPAASGPLPRGCLLYAILAIAFAFGIEYLAGLLRLGATSAFSTIGASPPQFMASWIFGTGRILAPLVGLALFIDWFRYWGGAHRGLLQIALYGLRWMLILAIVAGGIAAALMIWGGSTPVGPVRF